MDLHELSQRSLARRAFLKRSGASLGTVALASLLNEDAQAAPSGAPLRRNRGAVDPLHFAPKAKRVIYLFQPKEGALSNRFVTVANEDEKDPDENQTLSEFDQAAMTGMFGKLLTLTLTLL